MKKFFYLIIVFCFACKSETKTINTRIDTLNMLRNIIDNEQLFKDAKKKDTIYIIKSKVTNGIVISKTNKYEIRYLERNKKNEDLVDLSSISYQDKRTRIDFGKLLIENGIAKVSIGIYQYNHLSIFDIKLKQKNRQWTIINVNRR